VKTCSDSNLDSIASGSLFSASRNTQTGQNPLSPVAQNLVPQTEQTRISFGWVSLSGARGQSAESMLTARSALQLR